jgi:hypothetical protein
MFKLDGHLHSKQFMNFIISLIMMVQCWRGNVAVVHLCVLRRTSTLQSGAAKKPEQFVKAGCSTTRDIQTIGATNVVKSFEFVSTQNDSVD